MNNENIKNENEVFFFNTINITDWMKKKIENIIITNGYTLVALNNESEILKRMNKQSVVNNVNVEFKDKNNKTYYLTGYNSLSKSNEYGNEVNWLLKNIKLAEDEAIKEFNKSNKNQDYIVKPIDLTNVLEKTKDKVEIKLSTNITPELLTNFLTKKEFMSVWISRNDIIFEGEDGKYSKVISNDVEFYNFKILKNGLSFEFKSNDFGDKSQVFLKFLKMENSTKIYLTHKDVLVDHIDGIKRYWFEKVFLPISFAFSCVIKLE